MLFLSDVISCSKEASYAAVPTVCTLNLFADKIESMQVGLIVWAYNNFVAGNQLAIQCTRVCKSYKSSSYQATVEAQETVHEQ